MDLKNLFRRKEKYEIIHGSYGRGYGKQMEAAFNLYSKIKTLEDNVEYRFKKNKFAIYIYKKEDK